MVGYAPNRGDIIFLNLDQQVGHEQSGKRPAFVLSPRSYNQKTGLCIACPITKQIKGYPFEVMLPASKKVSGVILADQLRSIDWRSRKARFLEHPDASVYEEVQGKLQVLLP